MPEAKLQAVITALEASDELNDPRHQQAIRDLVLGGPLQVNEIYRQELKTPHPLASLWRAEIVQFLRTLVRSEGRTSSHDLVTEGHFKFSVAKVHDHVYCMVDSQSIRDLAILHLLLRLHEVGLRNVRVCQAPDCQHLFVKMYRREYCSKRCQARHSKQVRRAMERDEEERQQKRRRVARAGA